MLRLRQQQLRGFSLIELLLVIILIAAILLFGYNRFQTYNRTKDVYVIRQNINLLLQAADTYYYQNCRADQTFTLSMSALETAGLMPSLAKSQIATSYEVSTTYFGKTQGSGKPIYQLTASVTLNVPNRSIDFYLNALGASRSSQNQLYWDIMPNYGILTTQSGLWLMQAGLRQYHESSAAVGASASGENSCAY